MPVTAEKPATGSATANMAKRERKLDLQSMKKLTPP
jgi:hypothetical protein